MKEKNLSFSSNGDPKKLNLKKVIREREQSRLSMGDSRYQIENEIQINLP